MLGRKTSGSVVCPSCGSLVGVRDDKCYVCGRSNPSLWGFAPVFRRLGTDLGFVPLVIAVSTALYVLTLVAAPRVAFGGSPLNFLSPSTETLFAFGASGAIPVFGAGAWWTVLSASWLHGGLLHILFNMMSVRSVGPATAEMIGPGRTIIIYVLAGVSGFLLSSVARMYFPAIPFLQGADITVGASASMFGLLGALYHYGKKSGSSLIHGQAKQWALIMVVYGLIVPGIDNYAHAGGFLGGYAISAFFNPLTRERGDHLIVAGLCLAASFLAIAFSIFRNYSLIFS